MCLQNWCHVRKKKSSFQPPLLKNFMNFCSQQNTFNSTTFYNFNFLLKLFELLFKFYFKIILNLCSFISLILFYSQILFKVFYLSGFIVLFWGENIPTKNYDHYIDLHIMLEHTAYISGYLSILEYQTMRLEKKHISRVKKFNK